MEFFKVTPKYSASKVQKFNFDTPKKIVELFSVKTRENAAVSDPLAVGNFDFTRKIVKNILGEKLVKMLGICTFKLLTTLISREKLSKENWMKNSPKCWEFAKFEFLDKKLTFRIVWFYSDIYNIPFNLLLFLKLTPW